MLLVVAGLCAGSMSAWAQATYPYNVGTSTSDVWYTAISPVYSLSGNGVIDITFTNNCVAGGNAWENWSLICGKSTDTPAASTDNTNRYFVMRADYYDDIAGSNTAFTLSDGYGTDINTFQDGATVKLRISRVGTKVTVYTTVTKSGTTKAMSFPFSGVGENENLQFYLTQRLSYLTITEKPTITETIISQDYQDGVTDWTSGNTDRYLVNIDADGANKFLKAYVNPAATGNDASGGNGATITGSTLNGKIVAGSDFASSADFTLFFDARISGGTQNGQLTWFQINDASNSNGGDETVGTHMLTLHQRDGNGTVYEVNGATDKTLTLARDTWYKFQLSKSGNLLYLTVNNASTGAEIFSQQTIAVNSTVGGLGNIKFVTKRYNIFMGIDNIILRNLQSGDVPAGTATTYTIKYRNESDVEIASDVVVDALAGDEVTASAAQMNPITYNEQKYIYKEGNNAITLVADAASNVITLVYREANTYTYKVTSSLGSVLANSSDFEGETVTVTYPKYELDGTELKEAAKSAGTAWYANSYTLSANVNETITYNVAATPITNVVFYTEGEGISGATMSTTNNANIRNSNGAVGYAAGTPGDDDLTITTLAPGKYRIVANVHTSSTGAGTSTFILGANNFAADGIKSSYNTEKTSDEFTIFENTDLKLQAGGGAQNAVDYVYVIKTDEASVSKTITAAGWATYCSPYALDLEHATGLTDAYIVTGGDGSVLAKTSVKGGTVPANTGLLLKGDAGTATIPVVASSSTEVSANKLVGKTESYVLAANGGYVLMNDATNGLGFYKNNKAFTVGANTAYLPAGFDSTGAPVFYLFDNIGGTTGIDAVQGSEFTVNGEYYNVAGQRVAQPTKGLYIVNGKKVVVK